MNRPAEPSQPKPWSDHALFAWLSGALFLAAVAWMLWELATGRLPRAAALAGVSLVAGGALWLRPRLPSAFGLLMAIAAAVNALGYLLSLWQQETLFDEAVHFFTSFAGIAALGALLRAREPFASSATRLLCTLLAAGLVLGLLWEVFEWLVGILGSPRDTAIDLVMDMGGTLAGATLACLMRAPSRATAGLRLR